MCPRTEAATQPHDNPEALHEEGATYAVALLSQITSGKAGADELATLMHFMGTGPMLRGACAALCEAVAKGSSHETARQRP